MTDVTFCKELEQERKAIEDHYNHIRGTWQQYNDRIIPEDKAFAKRIILFLIHVIDYGLEHFNKMDKKEYQKFLAWYHIGFDYGPEGEHNYLSFDETLNGEPVTEFCWHLKDDDVEITKEMLTEMKRKYEKILEML